MNRKTTAAVTTACVGMAVSAAAYAMSNNKRRTKTFKKSTSKALRQVSDFIDNVSTMMR